MLYKKSVHEILKQIRRDRRKSQIEVARYSRITQNDLSKFENGKKDIRLSTLERIATALDLLIVPIPKDKFNIVEPLLPVEVTEEKIKKSKTLIEKYGVPDDE